MVRRNMIFARLNIQQYEGDKEYLDNIYEVLNQKERYTRKKFEYVISNLDILQLPDGSMDRMVYGIFNKINSEKDVEFFDYDRWTPTQDESIPNVNIHSKFFIFSDHIIVFEEIPNQISVTTFEKIFLELLHAGAIRATVFMQFSLGLIKEDKEVHEFIDELDKVTNIVFKDIQIPNPKSKQMWKMFEDTIKDTGATNTAHTNTVDGLNTHSEIFEGGFDLCHNAYMKEYVVSGEDKSGNIRKFYSKHIKHLKRVKITDIDDFKALVNKIMDLWRKL